MAVNDVISSPRNDRLSSWKEIAAFFDKDVRTVRRWETERRLPVHRAPGGSRSSVFAYESELDGWLRENKPVTSSVETDAAIESVETPPSFTQEPNSPSTPATTREATPPALPFNTDGHVRSGSSLPAVIVLLLALILALVLYLRRDVPSTREVVSSNSSVRLGKESANSAAQDLYLRGRYLWNQRTEVSLKQAVDAFTQAIVLDPKFAAGYAGLADSYILLRQYGHSSDAVEFPRALDASEQALSLDPSSPEAHRTHAFLLNYWVWDFPAADKEFQTAIRLSPADPQTHHWFATSLYSAGHYEDAMREIDLARRLQPDSIAIMANRGLLLAALDPGAALGYLKEVEAVNPNFAAVHAHLAIIYLNRNDASAYLQESELAATLSADSLRLLLLQQAQRVLTRQGPKAMLAFLANGFAELTLRRHHDAMTPAYLYVRLGENKAALRFLKLAYEQREAAFLRISNDPLFDPLRDLPEFRALLLQRGMAGKSEAASLLWRPTVSSDDQNTVACA